MGKQKRSENTYQKINTIFMRDVNNIIMPYAGYVDPVLTWLENCKFRCEEKIDGTNMRIEVVSNFNMSADYETESLIPTGKLMTAMITGVSFEVRFKGKTDNAQIPKKLLAFMQKKYTPDVVLPALGLKEFIPIEEFAEHNWGIKDDKTGDFTPDCSLVPKMWTVYGEGYGVGIQACGGNYLRNENKIIGFDVKVTPQNGNPIYLLKDAVDDILTKMGMPIVETVGYFTIPEAIEFVKKGFKSFAAEENPDFIAEGLVCKAPDGILDRRGNRIVFKVKTCDWNKYFAKYGTYDKVEQEVNTHIK